MKQVRIEILVRDKQDLNKLVSKVGQIAIQNPEFRQIKILWPDAFENNNGFSEIEFSQLLTVNVEKTDVRKVLYKLDEYNILKFYSNGSGEEFVKGRRVA